MDSSYKLRTLFLYLTEYCNLNCRHCWIDPEYSKNDSIEEGINLADLKRTVLEAKKIGLESVKLTGGEPFLYKHFSELVKWLSMNKIRIVIETNGTMIGEKEARLLKNADVEHVAIALDGSYAGLHEKMRGIKGCFSKTIRGMKSVIGNNLYLQVIFSLWKENCDDLKNTIHFARSIGARSFKINIIAQSKRAEKMKDNRELLPIDTILSLKKSIDKMQKYPGYDIFFDTPLAFVSADKLRSYPGVCTIKNILGILGDGSISICGIGRTKKDLIMGHISKDSIIKIWNENTIVQDIRRKLPEQLKGVCSSCILRKLCIGKCIAETYWIKQDLFNSYSFCQEAYENGLFPKSRIHEK